MSVSNFVQNCVEYAIKSGGPDFITAGEQAGEIQQLRQELRQKEETIDEKDIVIEKLQTELKRHRTAPFRDEDFSGVRQFDTELIDILQDSGNVRSERILRELNVDPQNTDLMQALQAQLRQLEQYGLVEETLHGWRWVDDD